MARVRDKWTIDNPDWRPKSRKPRRVPGARWGIGKRWLAIWEESGREVTLAFDTEDAAIAHIEDVGTGQRDGTHITKDKTDVTMADMWELWLAMKADKEKSTLASYTSSWARIKPQYGDTRCREIGRAEVVAWLASLTTLRGVKPDEVTKQIVPRPLSASMRRNAGIVIKALLDLAVDEKVIPSNPLKGRDLPKQGQSSRRYLEINEVDEIRAAMPNDEMRLVIDTLVMTGIRPGEAFGLQVGDLDVRRGRVRIERDVDAAGETGSTKSHKHRDVPVGGDLLKALQGAAKGRARGDWLLAMPDGRGWTRNRWRPLWDKAPIEHLGVTLYELRHTAASMSIHAGANVKTIQRMLGHASAAITLDTYGHLWDDELDLMPGRLDKHMKAERKRFAERVEAEAERQLREAS